MSKILFLLLTIITHFSYAMHRSEEEMFQDNYSKLSEPLKNFVNDFKIWPKSDQDKIILYSNSGGVSFSVEDKPVAANKLDGNFPYWLDKQLYLPDQSIPLFLALKYLKEKKRDRIR